MISFDIRPPKRILKELLPPNELIEYLIFDIDELYEIWLQTDQVVDKNINQKLLKKNPDVSGYVDKYGDSTQFDTFRMRVKRLHNEIAEYKKRRNLEYNRKEKLESLVQELNSLNREIEQGNVICAKCGSDKIIYKSKGMSFEVSNSYVRKQVLSSIAYQISQKEEIIREYGYEHVVPTFLDAAKVTNGGLNSYQTRELDVKKFLCSLGYYEIQTIDAPFPKKCVRPNASA